MDELDGGRLAVRRWMLDGVVVREVRYGPHGFPVGIDRRWYPSGELRRERVFPDAGGSAVADTSWYRSGQLKHDRCCPRARAEGVDVKFWPDGAPQMRGEWQSGRRVGVWMWWHPDGSEWIVAKLVAGHCVRLHVSKMPGAPLTGHPIDIVYDDARRPVADLR